MRLRLENGHGAIEYDTDTKRCLASLEVGIPFSFKAPNPHQPDYIPANMMAELMEKQRLALIGTINDMFARSIIAFGYNPQEGFE